MEAQRSKPPAATAARTSRKTLDLDALAASLEKLENARKPSKATGQTGARSGPAREDRQPSDKRSDTAALSALTGGLERRWNPDCQVAGGRDVEVHVSFELDQGGRLAGPVSAEVRGRLTPLARAAALRAKQAVYAAAPFHQLPPEFYGQPIGVNFDAQEACS